MLPPTRFELILATETGLRKIEWFGNVYVAGHEPHIRRFPVPSGYIHRFHASTMQRCPYIETCVLDSVFELASVHLSGAESNAGTRENKLGL